MQGPIEYCDELRPSSSHRTPDEIAEDVAGPIGGFPNHARLNLCAQNEPARRPEESPEHPAASREGWFNFLRAYSSNNTPASAYRRARKERP